MDTTARQIALSVLESLREDLTDAYLNNGNRVLDVADVRQYIYELMGRIRTTALQDICKSHKAKAHHGRVQPVQHFQ